MKKTVSINLNGQVFTIDEDAYDTLRSYLQAVSSQFANSQEGDEIIADIEARIAELFTEYLSASKQSITSNDVARVIEIMGKPTDFGDETQSDKSSSFSSSENRFKKRLYRDPDNRIIGGVASGIAAWFDIDPVIIRVLFVISFFIFGPLLYFILWIIIPLARTPSQRLEMRGEEVNLNNIEKIIKEEFNQVKESFRRFKKKDHINRFEHEFSHSFFGIVSLLKVFVKILLGIIVGAFLLVFVLFLLVMTHVLPFDYISLHCSNVVPFSNVFELFTSRESGSMLYWGVFLVVGTILLSIIVNITKVIIGSYRKWYFFNFIFTVCTFTGIVLIIVSLFTEGKHFNVSSKTDSIQNIEKYHNDTISVSLTENPKVECRSMADDDWDFEDKSNFSFSITSNKFESKGGELVVKSTPKLAFEQSKNDSVYVIIRKRSNGESIDEALTNAQGINYSWSYQDNSIQLSPYYSIQHAKWRNQKVLIIVGLPKGSKILFQNNVSQLAKNIEDKNIYTMIDGKLE